MFPGLTRRKCRVATATPNPSTINLKADGSSLTGNITNARGETPITDGKVDGDKFRSPRK